jgi:signal recognition particle subunit SRP54
LLEADVALPVVKDFVAKVRERAVGQEVVKSITPGQMVVKIVHDELVAVLGSEASELRLGAKPSVVLMAGLQGSGKTTTSAKLARRLRTKDRLKVLLASLDTQRPAAQQQLEVLARQVEVGGLAIVPGQGALDIARRALETARREGYDVLILDTAGRLSIDEALMAELAAVRDLARPQEALLVADALTGQDAVATARTFNERIGLTGIVLTRMDGDARGGAALSMRHVTGQPIKLVGTGERMEALEPFHPDRVASRILDMGDVVSLVEKASELVDKDEAEKLARKMAKGSFDLTDLRGQLQQMRKMGGMKGILGKLPGVQKVQKQLEDTKLDDRLIARQCAIIDSMTPKERRNADLLNASRKRRVAAGSGTTVQEVNRLLKQHRQMQDMMKRVKKAGGLQNLFGRGGMGGAGGGGGMLPPGLFPPR